MATTIKLKNSVTTTNTPSSLAQGEVAINITDKKVWVGNAATTPVQIVGAGSGGGGAAGSNTQVQYNSSGALAGDADFTFNGTTVTMANDASISGLTVGKGGGAVATNTAVGSGALSGSNSGTGENTAVGKDSLKTNSTGYDNAALGINSLYSNTTGYYNTASGQNSLLSNTTGAENAAFGRSALQANTTAGNNAAFGANSLYSNTTGTANTSVGHNTMLSNSTGSYNTAVGETALQANTTASYNTAIGYQAGYTATTNISNCFVGAKAGYAATGANNTYVGAYNSGGNGCGSAMTSGNSNTILGGYTGNQGGLDIRTASNYIVLSDGDGNPRGYFDASGRWAINGAIAAFGGINSQAYTYITSGQQWAHVYNNTTAAPQGVYVTYNTDSNGTVNEPFYFVANGNIRFAIRSNGGIANYQANDANLSDAREKINIELAGSYLDKICSIPVKTFNYIDQNIEEDGGLTLGVIAQDVQAVAPELVMESNWASKDEPEKMRLSIYQTDLQYALMKCIQELKAEVDSLKAQLNK